MSNDSAFFDPNSFDDELNAWDEKYGHGGREIKRRVKFNQKRDEDINRNLRRDHTLPRANNPDQEAALRVQQEQYKINTNKWMRTQRERGYLGKTPEEEAFESYGRFLNEQ